MPVSAFFGFSKTGVLLKIKKSLFEFHKNNRFDAPTRSGWSVSSAGRQLISVPAQENPRNTNRTRLPGQRAVDGRLRDFERTPRSLFYALLVPGRLAILAAGLLLPPLGPELVSLQPVQMVFAHQPVRAHVTLALHFDHPSFGGMISTQPFQQRPAFARTVDFQRCNNPYRSACKQIINSNIISGRCIEQRKVVGKICQVFNNQVYLASYDVPTEYLKIDTFDYVKYLERKTFERVLTSLRD